MTSKSKRNALSAVFVETVQETGTYSDGHGVAQDATAQATSLAHNLGNSTGQAHARTELFGQRRQLMEKWADFVLSGNKQTRTPGI